MINSTVALNKKITENVKYKNSKLITDGLLY
jgi:hypothetical protein